MIGIIGMTEDTMVIVVVWGPTIDATTGVSVVVIVTAGGLEEGVEGDDVKPNVIYCGAYCNKWRACVLEFLIIELHRGTLVQILVLTVSDTRNTQ